jgi:ATP adenylyltransferase
VARIDRAKRSLGTALKRTKPSRAASILVGRDLVRGRVLDYGCGHGFDADHFGWDGYDPYYRPIEPVGPYDTILCTLVLNTLGRRNRAAAIERIRGLVAPDGRAYLAVARNLPLEGKLGVNHCPQSYVRLTLPVVF